MANVYFKVLNRNISRQYTENIISGLQRELSASTRVLNQDLFDVSGSFLAKKNGLNVEGLLKYYLINQILKNDPAEKLKLDTDGKYMRTANPNYYIDLSTNKFYKKSGKDWVLAEDVVKVNHDGSYVVNEIKNNSSYIYKKVFNVNDALISLQLIDPDGHVVKSKYQVIELTGMRKEYAQKYKYSGYSGNSNDIMAAVLNKFSNPVETGYYMDRCYNLFKWDERKKCFVRNLNDFHASPLLIDYDFSNNKQVIRKEYTGIR